MPGMAAKVIITERQQQMLQSMAFSRCCPQGLAHRAEIILLAFEGLQNEEIAQKLQCERHGIGIWRKRWQKAFHRTGATTSRTLLCHNLPNSGRLNCLQTSSPGGNALSKQSVNCSSVGTW